MIFVDHRLDRPIAETVDPLEIAPDLFRHHDVVRPRRIPRAFSWIAIAELDPADRHLETLG